MQCSLFSISYGGLWGQTRLSLPEFIRKAAQLGYPAVMLAAKRPHLSPLDFDEGAIVKLGDLLSQNHLQCAALAAYTDFSEAPAAEVPYLEMQLLYLENLGRIAKHLGARVVRVFTAYERPGQSPSSHWDKLVQVLREACQRLQPYDVTVAIQNHHDIAADTDALLELLSEVDQPNCRLGFDAWSPALRGEHLYDAGKRAAPYTVMTTNADYIRLARYIYRPELVNYQSVEPPLVRAVEFGKGSVDYSAFFKGLCEGGFDGIANYEMCSPLRGGGTIENLDRYASAYLVWMRENGFAT